jgi:FtsZ-interacting cell division protein ZipA
MDKIMNTVLIAIGIIVISIILMFYTNKKKDINDQFGDIVKKNLRKDFKKALEKELEKPYYKN